MLRLVNSVIGFVLLLYPLAVYYGLQVLVPWKLSTVLMAMLLLRFYLFPADKPMSRGVIGVGIGYCLFSIWHNSEISLRFYPVWINLCLCVVFLISLRYPPSVIERIARLQHPNLSHQGVRYTQKVTAVWGIFFFINGAIAAGTALWSDFFWWSLYNGFIAYVLIAMVMGIEYLIRIRLQLHDN